MGNMRRSTRPPDTELVAEREELLQKNEQLLAAEERGDTGAIASLLHPSFWMVRANGACQSRDEFLASVPMNKDRNRVADRADVRLHGNHAIYTCRVTIPFGRGPEEVRKYYLNKRGFVRDAGEWRCINWQVKEVPGM